MGPGRVGGRGFELDPALEIERGQGAGDVQGAESVRAAEVIVAGDEVRGVILVHVHLRVVAGLAQGHVHDQIRFRRVGVHDVRRGLSIDPALEERIRASSTGK